MLVDLKFVYYSCIQLTRKHPSSHLEPTFTITGWNELWLWKGEGMRGRRSKTGVAFGGYYEFKLNRIKFAQKKFNDQSIAVFFNLFSAHCITNLFLSYNFVPTFKLSFKYYIWTTILTVAIFIELAATL